MRWRVHLFEHQQLYLAQDLDGFLDGGNLRDVKQAAAFDLLQLTAAEVGGRKIEDATEGGTLIVGAVGVADELKVHDALAEDNLLAAETLAEPSEQHHLHELLALVGDRTEAVDEP